MESGASGTKAEDANTLKPVDQQRRKAAQYENREEEKAEDYGEVEIPTHMGAGAEKEGGTAQTHRGGSGICVEDTGDHNEVGNTLEQDCAESSFDEREPPPEDEAKKDQQGAQSWVHCSRGAPGQPRVTRKEEAEDRNHQSEKWPPEDEVDQAERPRAAGLDTKPIDKPFAEVHGGLPGGYGLLQRLTTGHQSAVLTKSDKEDSPEPHGDHRDISNTATDPITDSTGEQEATRHQTDQGLITPTFNGHTDKNVSENRGDVTKKYFSPACTDGDDDREIPSKRGGRSFLAAATNALPEEDTEVQAGASAGRTAWVPNQDDLSRMFLIEGEDLERTKCAICLKVIESDNFSCASPCMHSFCFGCLRAWAKVRSDFVVVVVAAFFFFFFFCCCGSGGGSGDLFLIFSVCLPPDFSP